MSTVTFEALDADGAVVFNNAYQSGWGVSAALLRALQASLPKLKDLEQVDTLRFNAKLSQHPIAVLLGQVEETPIFTTEFRVYSMGDITTEDGETKEYAMYVTEYEGDRYVAFGPLADAKNYTAEACPEGGISPQAVPLDEWDEFVAELAALEIPEA